MLKHEYVQRTSLRILFVKAWVHTNKPWKNKSVVTSTYRQNKHNFVECGFTLKRVRDMTRTYRSFGQFGQMVECSFKN